MIIAISSTTFDQAGARIMRMPPDQAMDGISAKRRVTRTATLDGGAAIYDAGLCDADRTVYATVEINNLPWVQYIVRTYGLVNVTTRDGAFLAAPASWSIISGNIKIELLVKESI